MQNEQKRSDALTSTKRVDVKALGDGEPPHVLILRHVNSAIEAVGSDATS